MKNGAQQNERIKVRGDSKHEAHARAADKRRNLFSQILNDIQCFPISCRLSEKKTHSRRQLVLCSFSIIFCSSLVSCLVDFDCVERVRSALFKVAVQYVGAAIIISACLVLMFPEPCPKTYGSHTQSAHTSHFIAHSMNANPYLPVSSSVFKFSLAKIPRDFWSLQFNYKKCQIWLDRNECTANQPNIPAAQIRGLLNMWSTKMSRDEMMRIPHTHRQNILIIWEWFCVGWRAQRLKRGNGWTQSRATTKQQQTLAKLGHNVRIIISQYRSVFVSCE